MCVYGKHIISWQQLYSKWSGGLATVTANNDDLSTSNGLLLENIDKFGYLGNMLDSDGVQNLSVTAKV